jgi:hypothetical protein
MTGANVVKVGLDGSADRDEECRFGKHVETIVRPVGVVPVLPVEA